jgi:hypothetical protein
MRLQFLPFIILYSTSLFGQVSITRVDATSLPKQLKYSAHPIICVKWTDSLGLNYVLLTETGEYKTTYNDGSEFKNAALYAYHYVASEDTLKLLWKVYDYSKDCDFDLSVRFLDKTFSVTYLDKNGIAEVWLMYENQCTGDVSPVPTKIIMYEGSKKYALRGERQVKVSATDYIGGHYTLDENFKTGNKLFQQFATGLWEKNKRKIW